MFRKTHGCYGLHIENLDIITISVEYRLAPEQVKLHVYAGVPHNFAHYEELAATARDLKQGLEHWITA